MPNKQLTATMRLNTTQAEKKLKRIARAFDALNRAMGKQTKAYKAVNNALKTSVTQTNKVKNATNQWANSLGRVRSNANSTNSALKTVLSTVKKIAGAYTGIKLVELGIKTSDKITRAENRLNNLEGATPGTTAETMDKVYAAAQRARTGYTGMLSNVSKTMTLAGDSFQGNIDNAIRFQEIMAKAYTVGGASPTEASTSMYQLVQALGSGTLAGDELRSVREGAPLAYKAIERFAQKVYDTDESLKKLASDGKISSDMVVAAIMDMENGANNINDKFDNTAVTFGQAWDKIKNMATRAFQPALQSLNDALNNPTVQQGIEMLGQGLLIVGNILSGVFSLVSWVFGIFGSFFNWCAENWSWLSKVILTVLTIIGVAMAVILFPRFVEWISFIVWAIGYYIWLGATAVAAGIKAALAWMAANWVLLLIIVVIVAVLAALIWLSDGFSDACGIVVGVVMSAVAIIYNAFVGVINAIIQTAWSTFVEPFAGIIEWLVNAFNGGFDNIGGAFLNLLGQMLSGLIGLVKPFTKLLDTIFGWDTTGAIESAQASLKSWGKNENAVTFSLEAPTIDRWAVSDAYNTGYEWGHTAGDWITDKVSGLGNLLTGSGLPNPTDSSLAVDGAWDEPSIDELLSNVGDINDNMDMTDDDLEFLRKIAEMEWRNEFTTAEIKVDMTNNNTVNGERDLDGIVAYLSDVLRDEMASVAEGVHY